MPTILNPYINFDGNARDALEFYHSVFGGTLNMSTFNDFQATQDPSAGNRIMHGQLDGANGITLMCSDILEGMGPPFTAGTNFSVSLSGNNDAELRGYWEKLAAGSTITAPLEKSPWGDTFGMLTDKFGTTWLVNITAPKA